MLKKNIGHLKKGPTIVEKPQTAIITSYRPQVRVSQYGPRTKTKPNKQMNPKSFSILPQFPFPPFCASSTIQYPWRSKEITASKQKCTRRCKEMYCAPTSRAKMNDSDACHVQYYNTKILPRLFLWVGIVKRKKIPPKSKAHTILQQQKKFQTA